MDLGVPELLIIAVLIILLFGVGRIGKVGGELGKGIREFRTAVKEDTPADTAQKATSAAVPESAVPITAESKPSA